MKVTEGGGNASEGEYITKVFLSEDEVRALVANDYPISPPSMLYALLWWLENKCSGKPAPPKKIAQYEWHPRNITPLTNLQFEQMPLSSRFEPLRLHFTIGSLTRTWDLALCDESFAVLLYNEDTKELVFTQRFRPAALIGLALHHSPPKTKLDAIDWASQPPEWAYTLELCSGHHKRNCTKQEIEEKAKECVALKCGYKVEKLRFVTSYLIGISFSGDRQRAYYAKVNNSMKTKDWKPFEEILPCSIPCEDIQSYIHTKMTSPTRPPAVLLMMQWFLNNQQELIKEK
ncbi:hypothetical protein OESDEN_07755 [Oesophagostomum dentatum]|uniref:Nudix hydrolase domain-containing protein n=1 Tax=Oesophagostomum dentatum TaxID=61180 RepID=A0A0B1T964_OESDE|nr:hypothetical protein OESDEN_07755 [Oesophagostomum dentatum]